MPLSYHFEPGNARDGVTATIPLASLNQRSMPSAATGWCRACAREKALALLKSLPQRLRRGCVPLPEFAATFAAGHDGDPPAEPMATTLARVIRERTGIAVPLDAFRRMRCRRTR